MSRFIARDLIPLPVETKSRDVVDEGMCPRALPLVLISLVSCNESTPNPAAPAKPKERNPAIMNLDSFWTLIQQCGSPNDDDVFNAKVVEQLSKLTAEDVVRFDRLFRERMDEAFRWDLWGVAYIVAGGRSDDGFEYFRSWLISKGRHHFEAAMADPERAADGVSRGDSTENEGLISCAGQVYRGKTGKDLPPGTDSRSKPQGTAWKEDPEMLRTMHPKLAERFK